jgi:protease I
MLEVGHIAQNVLLQAVALNLGAVPVGAFKEISVRRACHLSKEFEPMYIISIGRPAGPKRIIEKEIFNEKPVEKKIIQAKPKEQIKPKEVVIQKKAVLVIASARFRDEELFETKNILEQSDIETTIACSRLGTITGMLGGTVDTQLRLTHVVVDDFDAVIFVGGTGAREYFNDPYAHDIAKQAKEKNKVLAAICIAPTILANAGLLDGIKATAYSSEKSTLESAGAEYTGTYVQQDGMIITGSGPLATKEFAQKVVQAIKGSN